MHAHHHAALLAAASVIFISSPAHAQCEEWLPGNPRHFPTGGRVNALTIFDADGAGPGAPELVVAGFFSDDLAAGFSPPNMDNLARFNGQEWRPFTLTPNRTSSFIKALVAFDLDGPGPDPERLLIGGSLFPLPDIVVTDGNQILSFPSPSGSVNAFLTADPDEDGPLPPELYAAGLLTTPFHTVVRWNGTTWEAVGPTVSGQIFALAWFDLDGPGPLPGRLIAGGSMTINAATRTSVAMFDGASWLPLGPMIGTTATSFSTFDFDGDGDTDIYFLNGAPLPGAKDGPPPRNALYRNDGGWRFTNVTQVAGVGDTGYGLGVCVGDYDNDGDPDLYVNNFGPNVLYRNNGNGTFSDVTRIAGVANGDKVGAGASFLDIDKDGDLDLFVANYIDFTLAKHQTRWVNGHPAYVGPMILSLIHI